MKRSEENWKDMVTKIVSFCVKYVDLQFYYITNKLLILGSIDEPLVSFSINVVMKKYNVFAMKSLNSIITMFEVGTI